MSDKLSDIDIIVLNAARSILTKLSQHEYNASPSEVRAAVMAERAEESVFKFLSTAHAYLNIDMTYKQLHNRPGPVPEPVPDQPIEPCPYYAIQENGNAYALVHCDKLEGHDDSHSAADWDGETAWEHPGVEA